MGKKKERRWSSSRYLEAFHAGLEGTDRITLSNQDASTRATHSEGRALAPIAIPADKNPLATNHHISRTHDSIRQRVAAAVDVVPMRLGHAIIHIDGREQQLTLRGHLFETVHTGSGLF